MPYRIKPGQEVLLIMRNREEKTVTFNRQVDFSKNELVASPLAEHNKEGIPRSTKRWDAVGGSDFEWGFDVSEKWADGDAANDVEYLYAVEVHQIGYKTDKRANSVIVPGSRANQYTIIINNDNVVKSCTCPGHRFQRKTCKHMRMVAERIAEGGELDFMNE